MAAQGRPILGIDVNTTEISVVEMRGFWSDAQILKMGSTPTPSGSLEGGRIVNPNDVAAALRSLLDRLGISTRDAILGLAASSVVTRILDLPNLQDSEARTVIEGELAHYQILRDNTGAFDYIRLPRPEESPNALHQALVMAAEEVVVNGYRVMSDLAGLHLVALEPSLLAMYRMAFAELQSLGTGVCLAIGKTEAEITITSNGRIRLYRRVDIGRDNLITEKSSGKQRSDTLAPSRIPFGEEEEPQETEASSDQPAQLNISAASNLTIEIQRSLDYYASQNPDGGTITRIVLATVDPELAPLAPWLSQAVAIETILAAYPSLNVRSPEFNSQLVLPDGLRFLGAAGLAMREMSGVPSLIPSFDLSTQQIKERVERVGRRRSGFSLTAAIAAIVLGGAVATTLGLKANDVQHNLERKESELSGKRKMKQQFVQETQTRQELLQSLKKEGFPFPRIMDAVTNSVADGAGLTAVSLDPGGRLMINGDAANEKEVILTLENLKKSNYFESASMESFDRQSAMVNHAPLVRFTLACQLAGARPAAPPAH